MNATTFEPAMSRKGLIILSGAVWALGGVMLFIRAVLMMDTWTPAGIAIVTAGLAIGAIKSRLVLTKVARRNIDRVKTMSPDKKKICLFAFQPTASYLLIAVMIGSGLTLRSFFPHSIYIAGLYFAVGIALLDSGLVYFRNVGQV